MMKLQDILEELKALPPEGLQRVAEYIHELNAAGQQERMSLPESSKKVVSK
jgi:hypothetical protein